MQLSDVFKQIKPCDLDEPYIFISYSNKDRELVWRDVLEFQKQGYNVWLDEKNLDKTKASWKEDALKAIEDMYCMLVVFYVSESSLTSEACYNELEKTIAEETKAYHLGPVKFIAIDVEEIGDIVEYTRELHKTITANSQLTKDIKAKKVFTIHNFMKNFFGSNNEKVRIHPKNEVNRKMNYYEDVMSSFPDEAKNEEALISNQGNSNRTFEEILEPTVLVDNETSNRDESQLNEDVIKRMNAESDARIQAELAKAEARIQAEVARVKAEAEAKIKAEVAKAKEEAKQETIKEYKPEPEYKGIPVDYLKKVRSKSEAFQAYFHERSFSMLDGYDYKYWHKLTPETCKGEILYSLGKEEKLLLTDKAIYQCPLCSHYEIFPYDDLCEVKFGENSSVDFIYKRGNKINIRGNHFNDKRARRVFVNFFEELIVLMKEQ